MTSIETGIALNQPGIKAIDMSKLKMFQAHEAPEEQYQRIIGSMERMLEQQHRSHPSTTNNPAYKPYATVVVDGKVVAKIDNHGWTETSNAIGQKLGGQLPRSADGVIQGPALAQARAEYLAEALGGEVVKSSTALTQSQFNAIPQPTSTVDRAGMKEDPAYAQLQKIKEARTLFLAQQIAQTPASG